MRGRKWLRGLGFEVRKRLRKIMQCLCSGEQLKPDEMAHSSESLATRDYSASGYSSRTGEAEQRPDRGNIEEAESSLREGLCLNYEEARALLGRLEYQRGNIEAALHVFDGIDIAAVMPKMKLSIMRRVDRRKRRSQSDATPPMSMHAVSLLLEAIFLKAKSLQILGRFKDSAQSCKVILDTVESALPEGMPENFGTDCKLQETLNKAAELLPELWKLAGLFHEAISSYRRALLYPWNLDPETSARIQKEFAIFLLYGGYDVSPPNFRSQIDGSFAPKNNLEEAILLLLILLRKFALKRIDWDPSIFNHLTFALSVSGELRSLSGQVEELLPGVLEKKISYYMLALCYFGEGDDLVALNLLKTILGSRETPNCIQALLLASKICGENNKYAEEGVSFARRALGSLNGECDQLGSVANCLLGVALSTCARHAVSDVERSNRQSEVLGALEMAATATGQRDPRVIYHLSLENAEQRKLPVALEYAKQLMKMEGGMNIRGWVLLAQILTAQKEFNDAEAIVNCALDETGEWDQGELLRTKAKIQIAQGQFESAIETYARLLAILHVRNKSFGVQRNLFKGRNRDRRLEIGTWHDLACFYTSISQWREAEVCISKLRAINPHSASLWHATGVLHEARDQLEEALRAFSVALGVEPNHVPSLVSTASIHIRRGGRSLDIARRFLADALKLDRTNHSAWYNLALLNKAEGGLSALEAADCFMASYLLEASAPVEPFR